MKSSTITAIWAILLILGGGALFMVAIVGQIHLASLVAMAAIGGGMILACQGIGVGGHSSH